jgi:hypothetical protein
MTTVSGREILAKRFLEEMLGVRHVELVRRLARSRPT